jgi:3-deoxy-manno-octulosonate cytidylyltransferase (CMP-KDO synthetase)
MTSPDHKDCIDRCTEASDLLLTRQQIGGDLDHVRYIIIQGDEPMFNPDTLNVDLNDENVNFYTLIKSKKVDMGVGMDMGVDMGVDMEVDMELGDPNVVKVIINKNSHAIYFSRYPIPYNNKMTCKSQSVENKFYKQIGIYSMSWKILHLYSEIGPNSYLETQEGIGLNRFIEYGVPVTMKYTSHDSVSVDTELDRIEVEKLLNLL